jgi:hypothetical protein
VQGTGLWRDVLGDRNRIVLAILPPHHQFASITPTSSKRNANVSKILAIESFKWQYRRPEKLVRRQRKYSEMQRDKPYEKSLLLGKLRERLSKRHNVHRKR